MKGLLSISALRTAIAAPSLVFAQSEYACERSNSASNAQDTLLEAARGALAGSVLAGRHDRGLGVVLGAVGGDILGNRCFPSKAVAPLCELNWLGVLELLGRYLRAPCVSDVQATGLANESAGDPLVVLTSPA